MTSYHPFPLADLDVPHPQISQINAFQRGWRMFCGPTPDVRRIVGFINLITKMVSSESCNPDGIQPPNADSVPNRKWGTIGCELMTLIRIFATDNSGSIYGKPITDIVELDIISNLFRNLNILVDPHTCTSGGDVDFIILDPTAQMTLTKIREVPGYFLFFLAFQSDDGKWRYHHDVLSLSSFVEKYHDVEILALSY